MALYARRASLLPSLLREELAAALTDLGTVEKTAGAPGWLLRYECALRVRPSYAQAVYNMGVAAGERGETLRAIEWYRLALGLVPGHVESACNLGVALRSLGHEREAAVAFAAALSSAPNHPALRANAAAALTAAGALRAQRGDVLGSLEDYHAALALVPRHGEALYNAGVAYAELGQLDKAIFMYELSIEAIPTCAEAWNNLGVVLRERGEIDRAAACYEAALRARPNFAQGLNNAAVLATQRGNAAQALGFLRAALAMQPEYAEAWNNLGVLQRDVGVPKDAIASYERCLHLDPKNRNAGQNRLLALNYVTPGEDPVVCNAHRAWGKAVERAIQPMPPRDDLRETAGEKNEQGEGEKDRRGGDEGRGHGTSAVAAGATSNADAIANDDAAANDAATVVSASSPPARRLPASRPLIVGYVSPDLHTHSVSYFAEAPLSHHDPLRVRTIVYDVCPRGDARTERLRAAVERAGGAWKRVASLSEAALADLVRADRVDVLVDLTGHTAGNRLETFARKPAPVQVTWIGYPNGTGLSRVDWRITDAVSDPVSTRQAYVERLWRLPGCFLCYTPSPLAPPAADAPALERGYVTFGSFNALSKQTPEVMRVWARILRELPSARLVLKNKPFACPTTREHHWRAWESLGVRRARVDLLGLAPGHGDHLAQYAGVDVALDPWPYAGTTTTTECLLMGVPCITRRGNCHAHRVGATLLTNAGLPTEWIAESEDEYVAAALRLATLPPSELNRVRKNTRKTFLASPLCDAKTFVRGVEDAYIGMWQDWLQRRNEGTKMHKGKGGEATDQNSDARAMDSERPTGEADRDATTDPATATSIPTPIPTTPSPTA